MRRWWGVGVVVALVVAGCGGEGGEPAAETGAEAGEAGSRIAGKMAEARRAGLPFVLSEDQARGKEVYEAVCWTCHGASARGDGPAVKAGSVNAPPDLTTGEYPSLTAEQLLARFETALEGADPSHPHMQYVTSFLRREVFEDALAYVPVIGYPPEIAGSAVAGGKIYADRCAGCHGYDGTGTGPVAEQLTVQPADFTTDSLVAAEDFEGLFARIREGGGEIHGSSMPAWGLLFDEDDMWDLAAYASTFQPEVLAPPPGGARRP